MAKSRREQILEKFAQRMKGLRAAFPGDLDDRDEWPVTGVFDAEETAERDRYGRRKMTILVRVEQLSTYEDDGDQSPIANELLADMIKTALAGDATLGGLCDDIQYQGGGVVFADTGSHLVGAFSNFNITYRTDLKDPFNLT